MKVFKKCTSGSSNQSNLHTPLQRTRSIIHGNPLPLRIQNPEKTVSDWLQMHPAVGNGCGVRGRSPSLTEHAPLSPQSSVTSSGSGGSDSHHDDGPQPIRDSFLEEGSGMRGKNFFIFFAVCSCFWYFVLFKRVFLLFFILLLQL